MKESIFNQMEGGTNGDLLLESLNFEQENIDKVIKDLNIPYEYLSPEISGRIDYIINQFIKPSLQDALRSKKESSILGESIQDIMKDVSPEILPIDKFLYDQKEIYVKKINLQNAISKFLIETLKNKDDVFSKKEDVISGGLKLYEQSLEIEPIYFGYNSQNKKFIDYCDNKYFEEYEKNKLINNEERLLLLTPSQPSYYLKREIDFSEYKISPKENRKDVKDSLIKLYFNNDEVYFDNYFKNTINKNGDFFIDDKNRRKEIQKNIVAIKEQFHNFFVKKQYFLLERKIRYAKEVDELLIIDNCFDKYFESKSCFLHDLFLKIYLMNWIDGKSDFNLNNSNMENSIKEALNFDDNELLSCKNNKNEN